MVAESEHVDAGHDVEFRSLGVRSILNRSVSKRMKWMVWSINPYRGCEFGCRYCYARYTHEFLAPAVGDGEDRGRAEGSGRRMAAGAAVGPSLDPSAVVRGLPLLGGDTSALLRDDKREELGQREQEAGFSTSFRFGRNDKLEELRTGNDKLEEVGSEFELGFWAGLSKDFVDCEGNAGPSTSLRFAQDDRVGEEEKAGFSTPLRSGRNDKVEKVDLRAPEAFERRIFVKSHAAWLLEQDLRRLAKQGRSEEEIALGTATDPWQPIERRAQVTRSLLEVLAAHDGLRLGVVTKSTLIERDIDLLQEIGRRSALVVHITITTPDAELARKLEPRAPRPDLRFRTVQRIRAAGIRCGILNSPLLPGITDSAEAIDRMAALAKSVDASFFAASPLFLKPCSRPTYFEFVREHFPHLQVLYEERFRNMDFASRPYRERLRALVRASCARHGVGERSMDELLTRDVGEEKKRAASTWSASGQGRLFG
jgi:DNA repair photolyase